MNGLSWSHLSRLTTSAVTQWQPTGWKARRYAVEEEVVSTYYHITYIYNTRHQSMKTCIVNMKLVHKLSLWKKKNVDIRYF